MFSILEEHILIIYTAKKLNFVSLCTSIFGLECTELLYCDAVKTVMLQFQIIVFYEYISQENNIFSFPIFDNDIMGFW